MSEIVLFIVRLLAPFIVIFSVYVILNGHITPGGGFQGGAILGALAIISTIVLGRERAEKLLPAPARPWLTIAAPLAFVGVGLVALALGGSYLYFPRSEELRWVATLEYIVIEIGIGVGGAAIVACLFWAMEREG